MDRRRARADDDDERVDQGKKAKVEETPLEFYLTALRGVTKAQNQYSRSLASLLDGDFTHAILTNYKVDVPWLFAQCARLARVPVLLVHGSHPSSIQDACKAYTNVTPIAPPLPIPYGTHHTKMMILFHPTFVRVAIFTANFVAGDWNYKTQGLWTQDFPAVIATAIRPCAFHSDLLDYMTALGPPVARLCTEKFPRYDFTSAKVSLVASVPGVYHGKAAMEKYGHLRMKRCVLPNLFEVQYRPKNPTTHPLVCQYSSLGSLDEKWLVEFYASMTGQGTSSVASPIPTGKLHLVWPSVADVVRLHLSQNSNEGWDAGRSLPCALKNLKPFLHKYLRAWHPPPVLHRQNAMPHIKSYAPVDPTTQSLDYVLLTSANLSKAAWGALQKSNTQFMIRSYELGVLLLPDATTSLSFVDASDTLTTVRRCPLPFQWPPTPYNTRVDEPWTWDLPRTAPDGFGRTYEP
ncbi:Aste57867_19783 [Aphanomyces stellatus]|uniref:Aste57867_19783 protein n=1 Tax=Aphanomyces stellatus TaxID=120398 RepID=A0A485LI01_9STRA|nr:hypothetical protein As57867_019718 [Aphanomyces stellatus]VFT96481.1 Aste57867_19783 [Aphanomyces stellatus]